jgi:L-threonylcarbamoyladenylate synthase
MTDVARAAAIIRGGGLVAFPTETVYGLGADATSSAAVARIFAAKGRPATNPLIVHVTGIAMAKQYAADWPAAAQILAERFWPGPLTLVLKKRPTIVDEATAGRDTVGLRAPKHALAQALLSEADRPLAAPSANRSMRVSPTTADHVRQQLGDSVDFILDGGACEVGIESTVLDLTQSPPALLRPGGVSLAALEGVVGEVRYSPLVTSDHIAATSPGQHVVHYSPHTPTLRFESEQIAGALAWLRSRSAPSVLLVQMPMLEEPLAACRIVQMPADALRYAQRLYSVLHAADEIGASVILIAMPPASPEWLAVRDRLQRAARPWPL